MRYFFILAIIVLCMSCEKEDDLGFHTGGCATYYDVHPPEGYSLEQLDSISLELGIETFQMIDGETGYALVDFNTADSTGLLKTTDGGRSWSEIGLDIPHDPGDMTFIDEHVGYITVYDPDRCKLYVYDDQEQAVQLLEYPELNGFLSAIHSDENDHLYAELKTEEHSILLRSVDQGISWDTLYSSPDFNPRYTGFSFQLRDDRIYLAGDHGTIPVIDREGDPLAMYVTGLRGITDLEVVDETQLIASDFSRAVSSDNGGQSWTPLHDDGAHLIDFSSTDEGLVVFQDSSCIDYDVFYSYDAIAHTANAGADWNLSGYTTGLFDHYKGAYQFPNGDYLLLFRETFYRLSQE